MLTNKSERVRKRGKGFGVPGCLTTRQRLTLEQLMSKNRHQRKESEQGRSGAQDGKVRPLSLRLHAQMSADFMKGDFPSAIAERTTPRWLGPEPADQCTKELEDQTVPAGLE